MSLYTTIAGQWNLNLLANQVLPHVLDCIQMLIPPNAASEMDSLAWNGSADGTFSTAQAYAYLLNDRPLLNSDIFSYIWKWQGPERIRYFLWKVSRGILMNNVARCRRGFAVSNLCSICQTEPETNLHLFRDCGLAKRVWRNIKADLPPSFYDQDSFDVWLLHNLTTKHDMEIGRWDLVFVVTLDRLWWGRNEWVFNQSQPSADRTIARVKRLVV